MGNVCLTLLDSVSAKRFLRHTLSIHPFSNWQNRSPNSSAYGVKGSSNRSEETIVLDRKTEPVEERYELGRELGRGQFGVIRLCTDIITGEELACKSIEKYKLTTPGDVEDVKREIQVLERLAGHPNIVELKAVYEDADFVHLVMELCAGGELFDRIIEKRAFSEEEAARVVKTLMEVVQYCHGHGVMHRDLKPENILLATRDATSPIKVADFGLSMCFKPGQKFSGMAGSAYYIAPEVLRGEYDEAVDVWSAGVVLYILLTGVPPFWDETEEGIFEAIKIGNVDLSCDPWTKISSAAKELVKGMLCSDVKKRLTPEKVLNNRWILLHSRSNADGEALSLVDETLPNQPLESSDLSIVGCDDHRSTTSCSGSFSQEEDSDSDTSNVSSEEGRLLLSFESVLPSLSSSTVGRKIDNAAERLDDIQGNAADGSSSPRLSSKCPTFDRWRSFSMVAEPIFSELLASIASGLDDRALPMVPDANKVQMQDEYAFTVPKPTCTRDTVLLETNNGNSMGLHDRESKRIGWSDLGDENFSNFSCEPSKVLWSPCSNSPAAHCHMQQRQSQHQPQSVY
ncbi:hypothetical protein O6H91_02G107000 [Diphasiastrum complanatum]|uniref:Uncharacterized protein n=1 Tax=Diphasiastrum complanatum TaxID=34168 RepID=A0ACC2EJ57_DIPCM|nr:hypothetical protein O6H91_02G107000 [Diphasiastrum complanatum]